MIVSVHQPQYLPWLGYFDKIIKSDIFVILDDVQYKKNEWQNRNRIKTATGWQWLTVPVTYKFPEKINQVKINSQTSWRKDHLRSLEVNYRPAKFFNQYYSFFQETLKQEWEYLSELNIFFIEKILFFLGIKKKILKSSELAMSGEKTDRLVNICKILGGETYLSGIGAKDYLEIDKFEKEKIKVVFQEFVSPVYPQLYNNFVSNLSVVDLLFNCGEESLDILLGK